MEQNRKLLPNKKKFTGKNGIMITAGFARKKTYRYQGFHNFELPRIIVDSVLSKLMPRQRSSFCSEHLNKKYLLEIKEESTVKLADRLSEWLWDSIKSKIVPDFLQMSLKIKFFIREIMKVTLNLSEPTLI